MYLQIITNNKSACRLILMVCVNWNPFHSSNINPGVKIIKVYVWTHQRALNNTTMSYLREFLHEKFAPAKFLKNCWLF